MVTVAVRVGTPPKHAQTTDGVRCQNTKCKAKLAGFLDGTLRIKCRNCGLEQTITIRAPNAD